jgi:hypothetical protein
MYKTSSGNMQRWSRTKDIEHLQNASEPRMPARAALVQWIAAHCRHPDKGNVRLSRAERRTISAIVASDKIQLVGGELAAFLVLANVCARGPAIVADVPASLVWDCASTKLRAMLRYDGAIIAHPITGRTFPARRKIRCPTTTLAR